MDNLEVYTQFQQGNSRGGLLEAAIEIAKGRTAILARMKAALEATDQQTVVECAAQLCGFEKETVEQAVVLAGQRKQPLIEVLSQMIRHRHSRDRQPQQDKCPETRPVIGPIQKKVNMLKAKSVRIEEAYQEGLIGESERDQRLKDLQCDMTRAQAQLDALNSSGT